MKYFDITLRIGCSDNYYNEYKESFERAKEENDTSEIVIEVAPECEIIKVEEVT